MKERPWGQAPYAPIRNLNRATDPYICRLAPYDDRFIFEWFDKGSDSNHVVYWRIRGSQDSWQSKPIKESLITVDGLADQTEYEFYISREDGSATSTVRLVYTYPMDAEVINYNHPEDDHYAFSGHYLSSPGIIKLPSGRLLITHDVFGGGPNQGLTILYKSDDGGKTWQFLTEMYPLFWPKFFVHNDKLYALGCARQHGDLIISESSDEGATWRTPVTLLYGDNGSAAGWHQSCTPVVNHNGRLYTCMESGTWGLWNDVAHGSTMLSVPCDCDLMVKENWDFTPLAFVDPKVANFPTAEFVTCIEGNAVAGPDGNVYNILRIDPVNCERKKAQNAAVLMKLKSLDEPLEFVQMLDVKVGIRHKFYTLRDEKTGLYFMVHNEEMEKNIERRCIISLSVSEDLFNWRKLTTLLDCTEIPSAGYSYPSFCIDGDDLLYVSRSAFGKRKSEHDNNYVTFHRLKNFRDLL